MIIISDHYTVRVYNSDLADYIEEVYGKCKSIFSSKNPFLVECLKRGVEEVNQELFYECKPTNLKIVFKEIQDTVKKLDRLTKMFEQASKETLANIKINQKLLSCIYNISCGISEGNPKSKRFIESGTYDALPERLMDLLDTFLKVMS